MTAVEGSATRQKPNGRSFEERYGAAITSRGIATFPTLILRWQAALNLSAGELVTLGHLLSYYLQRNRWPSVSINRIAEARNLHRSIVEREIAQLESKGYVVRAGTDTRFGTFRYDLSGLLTRLEDFAVVEESLADLKRQGSAMRRAATVTVRQHKETEAEDEIENSNKRTEEKKEPNSDPATARRKHALETIVPKAPDHAAEDGREAAAAVSA